MSNIELNATNIKKFSKRLHKHATEKGFNISLSESQELFAKSLGHTNYHNLCNSIVEKEKIFTKTKEAPLVENITESYNYPDLHNKMNEINQKIVEKLIKENRDITVEEQVEVFYEKFILVLNAKESGIVNCYLDKSKDKAYDYKIIFTTIYNDQTFINLSSFQHEGYKFLIDSGIKEKDAIYIMRSFQIHGRDSTSNIERHHHIQLNQRFEMIEFNEKLWEFLNKKTKVNEKYVFKCIEHESIEDLICLNGKYYNSLVKKITVNDSHLIKDFESLPVECLYKDKKCYKLPNSNIDDKKAKEREKLDLGFDTMRVFYSFDVFPDEKVEILFMLDK